MANLTREQRAEREAAKEAAHQQELDDLRRQLETERAQREEAERRADWYEQMDRVADVDTAAVQTEHKDAVQVVDDGSDVKEPQILHDPFDAKNPHKIIADPPGFKLGWKNPVYRDGHRGWRGWQAVEHDSEIGRNLKRYLLDPPRRMEHAVDNYVRRGDSVLCYIDEEMWLARQNKRLERANKHASEHAKDLRVDRPGDPNPTLSSGRLGGRVMTS